MLGAIVGDIVGSIYEFNNCCDKDFLPFFHPQAKITDDTVCTVAVADILLNQKDPATTLRDWCLRYEYVGGWGARFGQWFKREPLQPYGSFGNGAAMRVSPAAFLAIGDEALRLKTVEGYPYCCDLGEAWTRWTGLPFVFALWVVQRNAVDKGAGEIPVGMGALAAAKQWGCSHLDTICAEALRKGILRKEELEEYYRMLGYNLDGNEQSGLERFFGYLPQIGEVPEAPRLELFSPLASVA